MKLADDALIRIIEIFRQGLMEQKDISSLLRELDLERNDAGRLAVSAASTDWAAQESELPETD
jgi:hypothetical protein